MINWFWEGSGCRQHCLAHHSSGHVAEGTGGPDVLANTGVSQPLPWPGTQLRPLWVPTVPHTGLHRAGWWAHFPGHPVPVWGLSPPSGSAWPDTGRASAAPSRPEALAVLVRPPSQPLLLQQAEHPLLSAPLPAPTLRASWARRWHLSIHFSGPAGPEPGRERWLCCWPCAALASDGCPGLTSPSSHRGYFSMEV